MYNLLHERLTPEGKAAQPKYSLRVRLRETVDELLYERDETATRANLTLRADYELRRVADDEVIAKGTSRATSGYDILSSQYATLTSKDDARDRSARVISDDIRTRMAVALSDESN
jgi:LPS-assembly lipoprotein